MPDRLVDELVPESVDWERLVRRYPLPCLALAAAGGFILGRHRGSELIAALTDFATRQASDSIHQFLGPDA
ncbi:MAG: hypothetical protein AAF604_04860 [Acidobacteriota bacterium]